MKTWRLLLVFCIPFVNSSFGQAQKNYFDKMNIVLLKNFYTSYIVHFVHDPIREMQRSMDTLTKGICTDKLYKKIKSDTTLDEDPFLKTPMYVDSMLYTLTIKKDIQKPNRYVAKYTYNDAKMRKDTTFIHIQMIENKIDSLW